VECWKTTLRNKSGVKKDIQLFSFIEFCFYEALNDSTNFQRTFSIGEVEVENGAIYHKTEYRERRDHYTLFACTGPVTGFDTSRDEFVGVHRGLHDPQAVLRGASGNSIAHGWNPIGSHCVELSLAPGREESFTYLLGFFANERDRKFDAPGNAVLLRELVRKCIEGACGPADVRHAQATHVGVQLHVRNRQLVATIEDDGVGFNAAARTSSPTERQSLGLVSMQERAGLLGGRLEVFSEPGQGTRVQARLPLK